MKHIPNSYRPPQGLPLRWQDEHSGTLPAAVRAFLDAGIARTEMADTQQFLLVREWLSYYICAPCWNRIETNEEHPHLAKLKASILTLSTRAQVSAWIWECLELGIDPL